MRPQVWALAGLVLLASPASASELVGSQHTLLGGHLNAGGALLGSLGQPAAQPSASGGSHGARFGFWALALPDLMLELELFGTASGGSVSFEIAGVPLVIPTTPGASSAQVAADIAAAIEADAALFGLGVRAVAAGGQLFTNGALSMLEIADAGLGGPPVIPALPIWSAGLMGALLLALLALPRSRGLALGVFLLLCMVPARATTVPLEVSYQGQLLDAAGLPLTATVTLELRLWNDATSTDPGDLLYEETHASVSVQGGVFQVALGGGAPSVGTFDADLLSAPALWLETEVDSDVLAPRERLLAVPYAVRAETADDVGGLDAVFVQHYFEQTNLDGTGPPNTDCKRT